MIQKFIFSFLIPAVFAIGQVQAQCMPDTTVKSSGYQPDTLKHAKTWEPYSQVITVLTPRDTTVNFGGSNISVKVDSIVATNVLGLPPGFSYTCMKPGCAFVWNEPRCVELHGTTNQAGILIF